jgi:hypothetical protein
MEVHPVLLAAAGLASVLALAHSYLGERYILMRLFRRGGLPTLFGGTEFTGRTLRFAWHLTSIAWLSLAAILVKINSHVPSRAELGLLLAWTFGVSGVVAFVGSRGRHLSWVVFLAITTLAWLGSR